MKRQKLQPRNSRGKTEAEITVCMTFAECNAQTMHRTHWGFEEIIPDRLRTGPKALANLRLCGDN